MRKEPRAEIKESKVRSGNWFSRGRLTTVKGTIPNRPGYRMAALWAVLGSCFRTNPIHERGWRGCSPAVIRLAAGWALVKAVSLSVGYARLRPFPIRELAAGHAHH